MRGGRRLLLMCKQFNNRQTMWTLGHSLWHLQQVYWMAKTQPPSPTVKTCCGSIWLIALQKASRHHFHIASQTAIAADECPGGLWFFICTAYTAGWGWWGQPRSAHGTMWQMWSVDSQEMCQHPWACSWTTYLLLGMSNMPSIASWKFRQCGIVNVPLCGGNVTPFTPKFEKYIL